MKLVLKWSKRQRDWLVNYEDRAGKHLCGVLFDMVKTTGHRVDWQQDLKTILTEKGYDYTTLKITCKKLVEPNPEESDTTKLSSEQNPQ